MRHPFRTVLAALALATLPTMLPLAAQDTYKIDPVHSEVSFKVRHALAKVSGRFAKFSGSIKVDTADISKSSVEVSIDATSITTDNEGRDKHLKSPDFFDVAQFPTLTFKSTAVKEVAKGKLEVTGDLTMHGVTKRITFPITNAGTQANGRGGVVAGFIDGALTLNRSEYGVKYGAPMVGDEVTISLNVEAGK